MSENNGARRSNKNIISWGPYYYYYYYLRGSNNLKNRFDEGAKSNLGDGNHKQTPP